MKKTFLLLVMSVAGFSQISFADYTCTTRSRGYEFIGRGYDERDARYDAQDACERNRNSDRRECERNMYCRQDRDDRGGSGRVWASPNPCYSRRGELCTTYVEFDMDRDTQIGIVSVIDLDGSNREQVFACHMGSSPANPAPWIAKGQRYQFKLYAVRSCEEGIYRGRVVDTVMVEGR